MLVVDNSAGGGAYGSFTGCGRIPGMYIATKVMAMANRLVVRLVKIFG